MTISEVLAQVDEVKPNTYDENLKITWLSELDARVFNEIIMTHEHELVDAGEGNLVEPTFTAYTENDEDEELIIPTEYADVYRNYLYAKIDFSNGESDRFTNSMIMFNSSYQDFANHFNSTHKPIQKPLKLF